MDWNSLDLEGFKSNNMSFSFNWKDNMYRDQTKNFIKVSYKARRKRMCKLMGGHTDQPKAATVSPNGFLVVYARTEIT